MAATAVLVAPGCDRGGHRPARLLDGRPAARFDRVDGSVIAFGRVVGLDARADRCLAAADHAHVAADTSAVERVGVNGASLTFANRDGSLVYACDVGIDLAGERAPPWCHTVVGEVQHDRVVDPRLDVLCSDRSRRPLAYAFVDPIPGARWIGVRQDTYVELYEVLGTLPVRVASTRGIDAPNARATFEITQYDASGDELVRGEMEAAVAG